MEHLMFACSKGRVLVLFIIFRLVSKRLTETNALAYFGKASETRKKEFYIADRSKKSSSCLKLNFETKSLFLP